MKEKLQALLALCDKRARDVSQANFLMAVAPVLQAVESGEQIPDDAWLLIRDDMRPALISFLVSIIAESLMKK